MTQSRLALPMFAATLLACAPGFAQSPAPQPPPHQLVAMNSRAGTDVGRMRAGELMLAQATDRLERYSSVSTKIRQQAELFGMKMIGTGIYLQGPAGSHCMRLEMKLQVENEVTSLQQVCDGTNLWILRRLGQAATLGRVEVAPVLDTQRRWSAEVGQGTATAQTGPAGIGVGGLPRVLRSLNHSFQFADPIATKLVTLPVYEIRGVWRPDALKRMLPEKAIAPNGMADLSKLPESVPDEVIVLLGRDDLFPYRIEYRRRKPSDDDSEPALSQVLLIMELYEVRANETIERRLFEYQPGDMPIAELTSQYVETMRMR